MRAAVLQAVAGARGGEQMQGSPQKRVGAPVAATCYEDLTPVRPRVAMPPVMRREPGTGRPTKKERRELNRLLGYDPNFGHKE